ncbi:Craniofacial development protein 2 [Symbiodinium microadriaticum]|uniref:Craniofacial development protein 2 n=1 Tax=Symbiodinium microadriaticum TaxID=2951 RepID=A0A1Q9F6C8_SYMMI|nr:Craniofacial development protein 2 [Symbiodinium microadriaticum]
MGGRFIQGGNGNGKDAAAGSVLDGLRRVASGAVLEVLPPSPHAAASWAYLHCPGRRGGRRRRPRDSEREARRPPKRVRAAGADGDADSSSYESSGGPDISTEVGTGSTRPLTMFSVGHATATATTRSTAAGGTLAQAARGADVEVVRPSGSSVSAQDNFCSDALRQEMAPDEFMAMASLMGRDYAVPKRATQALPSSSVAAPPASAQSGPAHARAPTSTPSSTSLGSSPVKRRFTERHWPAGALPPRRPASIGPAADEATARISERTRAPDKPVGSASVPSSSPTTADGGLLGRRATSPSTLRPSTIAYAKPRPKVRARDRVPTGQTTADGVLDPATPAAARVPSEPQPEQSRMDPCPSTDVPRPDSQGSPGTRQGGEVHDVSTEQAAGSESPAKTSSAAASLADIAPVHVREETTRRLGTEVMDSSSEEEADHELIRLRRRGDLPVKISAVTGLPSGVASLRRDPITGSLARRADAGNMHRRTMLYGLPVSGEAGSAPPAPRQAPAKPLGTQDATCRSPLPSMQRQKIVKRSLQRVHRRILRTGGAWYKGKWYNQDTASALTNRLYQQQTPASVTPAPHDSRANSRAQVHSVTTHLPSQSPRHLQVYTWNVGGLGGGLYDEILYYIHRHPVDVLVIQETKWRFTSRWDTHQYFFVHSGSSAADFKQGGLLTIVAKRLVDPGTLRYVDPLPGRLLRVQFYRHSQPCDVLNFYQHTWKATDHIRRLRTQALDHLTRTIHMIPKRSLMIIGGDFNATCVHSAPHVGRCVMERSQLWATDQEDLQALILGLHLCALNTFQSQHPHHTYMWGTQQSQIDYLFVRCDMADGLSRQSYAMHDHPLGAWRGGARHFLVHSQIPTHWRPWSGHASPSVAPAVDRHAIADALSGKADPRIQAFRTDVQSALNPAPASISELHDTVHSLALKHFPKPVPVRGPRPWQDGTLQQYASRMWGHLRSLRKWAARKDAHSSLQALFQCWRHSTLHLRMHRDARQQGRELRKQRRLSLLSDADQAIRQGQSRQFYQLIDKLAPKGRFRKFQMCKGGDLLTPAEELEVMRKHFVQYAVTNCKYFWTSSLLGRPLEPTLGSFTTDTA